MSCEVDCLHVRGEKLWDLRVMCDDAECRGGPEGYIAATVYYTRPKTSTVCGGVGGTRRIAVDVYGESVNHAVYLALLKAADAPNLPSLMKEHLQEMVDAYKRLL